MDHSVDSRFEFDPARGRRIELFRRLNAGALFLASRLKEHIAEDGPTVFAHACRLGTEGIVSKKVDGAYLAGPCRVWIKVRNPASVAVQRERSEVWNK
jgi:ATP-dependent DNA ligase